MNKTCQTCTTETTIKDILEANCNPFPRRIARGSIKSRFDGTKYTRYYRLRNVENGIQTDLVEVYSCEDSCFFLANSANAFKPAYAISQFDVHDVVRGIVEETDYVITEYPNTLSDSQRETIGLELSGNGGES